MSEERTEEQIRDQLKRLRLQRLQHERHRAVLERQMAGSGDQRPYVKQYERVERLLAGMGEQETALLALLEGDGEADVQANTVVEDEGQEGVSSHVEPK